jgi:hypothetical protein
MAPGGWLLNIFRWKHDDMLDERFIMHRFKSTRLAVLAGLILLFAFFTYDAVVKDVIRWDLFAVSAAIAVVKVCAMIYYQRTN